VAEAAGPSKLAERLSFYAMPKLLVVDELGYPQFEEKAANLFSQLVARRHERAACSSPQSDGPSEATSSATSVTRS
jgi:DNA replication protein DnaC